MFGPGILPLVKGSRLFGRASTVQFVPTNVDSDRPYDDAISYIDALNTGDVAVLATGGNLSSAYWGELFSAAAIGRGAVGVVTYSGTVSGGSMSGSYIDIANGQSGSWSATKS